MNLQNACFKMRWIVGILLISTAAHASSKISHIEIPSLIQNQLAETAQLLRSSQNSGNLKVNPTLQLMNLCKVIGQSQVLLLQIKTDNLELSSKNTIDSTLQTSVAELHQACDGSSKASLDHLLKRAWQLTAKVQKRLTYLSRSLNKGEAT